MTLATGAKLAFAMLANGNAEFIEFDAVGGSGTIGSGTMEKADTTAYSTGKITGDYAFGAAGFDNVNNRAAIEGRFTSNGTGTLTNAAGDVNAYGTDYSMNFTAANYTVSNTATGRGTIKLAFTFGGTPDTLNFVFYVVNSGKLFVMERDSVTTATPLLNGSVLRQQTPAWGFSNASLNGSMVIYLTGLSVCGSAGTVPKAVAGLLTADGKGAFTLTYDENFCSAPGSNTGLSGSYSVASNGRASITVGGYSLVAYLVSLNQTFLSVSDANVLFGFGEPQAALSFTNSALKGTYAGFATNPADFGVAIFSGEFAADGASPTGHINGTEDIGAASGPKSGVAFNATYSVSSSPTNGRGTMTVTSANGGKAVIYTISPSKFVAVSLSDANPSVQIFEQALPPPTPSLSLSSLSLNPTTVIGRAQSSTGTVTLSGPAPAGGAQVPLFSDNGAATVPSSVTVPAWATSATFPVSTSAVAAPTHVTISASYGGVSKSAWLTVTPTAATLSSLTLNPTSVIGGAQSSTGTVTLSGPAPAGGALVTLSSSNGAASVPPSVTVPAGATSATFPVNTTAVAVLTPVIITGTYGGGSKSATLTVTPAATLVSLTLNPTSAIGGLESSTGTVTLNGPAPAGGAQVALSSDNLAAGVPPSVTIPAGMTSASFPVNTLPVLFQTSVTITASYGGNTVTATLTVTPLIG
jgi:trimeric autotransporter adhesin